MWDRLKTKTGTALLAQPGWQCQLRRTGQLPENTAIGFQSTHSAQQTRNPHTARRIANQCCGKYTAGVRAWGEAGQREGRQVVCGMDTPVFCVHGTWPIVDLMEEPDRQIRAQASQWASLEGTVTGCRRLVCKHHFNCCHERARRNSRGLERPMSCSWKASERLAG